MHTCYLWCMHTKANATRIVPAEEAASYLSVGVPWEVSYDLAGTVATEPDRTRAAVVKALRSAAADLGGDLGDAREVSRRADAIENGADW